ncbi:MAG: N-acetyl-gamma-glutamyl-phosphate reductase [Enterococcus sp.]
MKAAIIGVTGYGGLELVRIIENHPVLELGTLHSHSMHDNSLASFYPGLQGLVTTAVEAIDVEQIMAENDLVFFATPSGISRELAIPFVKKNFPIIDLSGDLRLKNPADYQRWYKKEPAPQALLDAACYSVPEFSVITGNLVANPGCYATAAELSVAPLALAGVLDPTSLIFDGKSGLSGAGKNLAEASHFVNVHDNMSMYKLNQHQHIPEITQQLQLWDPAIQGIQFTTSLIPVTRGIFMTTYAKIKTPLTETEIYQLFEQTYQEKPFVRIQPQGSLPNLKQVIGSNFCDIGLGLNEETQVLTIVAVIDNLVKGAAGLAIQNFNKWAKIDETSGLKVIPQFI